MIVDTLKDIILQNIGILKPASKNYKKRNCFLCHTRGHGLDKRERFGIQFNPTTIVAHCFNCGFKAVYEEGKPLSKNFELMLTELGAPQTTIKEIRFALFKISQSTNISDTKQIISTVLKDMKITVWPTIKLTDTTLSIKEWVDNGLDDPDLTLAIEYLISRKIYEFDKFYWSFDTERQMNNRVILPYYYHNKIVGYTARLVYDSPDKSVPKYLQHCPEDFVYNLDPQEEWERKIIILTEGVLDAYVTDGVGTLGEINQEKVNRINRLQKRVIVIPDRDNKGYSLVEAAIKNKWAVSFPKWKVGIKDAAKASEVYGRLLTVQSIINSAITDKNAIELKWKIERDERDRLSNI